MSASSLTQLVLQLVFLVLLWVFVFAIVYSLRSDLFGPRTRAPRGDASASPSPFPSTPLSQATVTERIAAQQAAHPISPAIGTSAPAGPTEAVGFPFGGPGGAQQGAAPGAVPRHLVIVAGPKEGLELDLPGEELTIGRSSESDLVIRDDYTSTHHARLLLWGDHWVVQDLDSTNGTFVEGSRVTTPTPVHAGTQVRIGATTFELRR